MTLRITRDIRRPDRGSGVTIDAVDNPHRTTACSTPDCPTPATLLVQAQDWTDDAIAVTIAWASWEDYDDDNRGMYCLPHAGEMLSRLPSLAPHGGVRSGGPDIFTHTPRPGPPASGDEQEPPTAAQAVGGSLRPLG